MRRPCLLPAALALLLCLAGCGYHVVGRGAIIPADTKIIAVLPFENHTKTPQLSQSLSAAVSREFLARTHYHIQATAAGSDLELHGDLLRVEITPVTFDQTSGRATTAEVVLHLKAWLTSTSTGKELFRNDDMIFHDQYQISTQQQNFIEEETPAFDRLTQSVAQTLVADILEAF